MTSYLKEGEGAEKYKADIPLNRFASTEDIANACLFLASNMGSYITGQVLSVCGGLNI
jgi:3-oxoacyl-[acyl-carrier protein] reductase